jgi:hypothetical protein
MAGLSSLVLFLLVTPGANRRKETTIRCFTQVGSGLTRKHHPGWKFPPGTNTLTYFGPFVSYREKKLYYDNKPRGLYHKTYYGCNLRFP